MLLSAGESGRVVFGLLNTISLLVQRAHRAARAGGGHGGGGGDEDSSDDGESVLASIDY